MLMLMMTVVVIIREGLPIRSFCFRWPVDVAMAALE